MLMRKPGPVKAHSFRRLNVPCKWEWGMGVLSTGAVTAGFGPRRSSARLASLALHSLFLELG